MIITEIIDEKFKKTYSDKNKMVQKVGTNEFYSEAIDVLSSNFTYIETDEDIVKPDFDDKEIVIK